ncbi:hypothetical protein [Teredinibacter sp. KSP-S5-2]|uniref:hypothetical protein n=1 Tax=Teredinibacter sp. KSP-S5-2 TaxID=3034506 RepID=UPI002934AE72|nr:hypothetical protein [Teredinibacter sp. KSP-S5-2]WNO07770.1 hypothetical protein P5V12_12295 [Teredinibacter sp. KSP-S5-2]
MKAFYVVFFSLLLISCSEGQIEEFVFRKTLEISLVDLCGEEDKGCVEAVKSQVGNCMETSNWRMYMENEDNQDEFNRFIKEFYSCIVDEDGNPYFEPSE